MIVSYNSRLCEKHGNYNINGFVKTKVPLISILKYFHIQDKNIERKLQFKIVNW